jgi:hypothetical protein
VTICHGWDDVVGLRLITLERISKSDQVGLSITLQLLVFISFFSSAGMWTFKVTEPVFTPIWNPEFECSNEDDVDAMLAMVLA